MKKKILALILTLLMSFSLVGCNSDYPKVKVLHSTYTSETTVIDIGSDYKLKDYQKVTNDDGSCSVTINFEKSE